MVGRHVLECVCVCRGLGVWGEPGLSPWENIRDLNIWTFAPEDCLPGVHLTDFFFFFNKYSLF